VADNGKVLAGRVALVNAAGQGIGRGTAEALAAAGARLVVAALNADAITSLADDLAARHGIDVVGMVGDVTLPGTAQALVEAAVQRFGGLDILVNNSGGPPRGKFADFDDEAWQGAFDLLLLSVVRMVRAALPFLRASAHGGRIVTVASTSVKQPITNLILSNSLRAGVAGLSKTLADELAPDGITVNLVCPGSILTDRLRGGFRERAAAEGIGVDELAASEAGRSVPLGRLGTPADLGNLICYLCSDAGSYITGQVIAVDGGLLRGTF
jgi:3-oxoacyl-[acyl-carrier protein] reductase